MSTDTRENIRNLLIEWREAKAAQWGLTEQHDQFCARNSYILHDIFVDSISANARNIHNVRDLHRYAFYWKWIDVYGQELFSVLRAHLESPKRVLGEEDHTDVFQFSPKKVRTEV